MIRTSLRAPTRTIRRQMVLRVVLAGGAIILAACEPDHAGDTDRSSRSRVASSTTAAPTTTTTPPPVTYPVKRGDTLTAIARFFGVSTRLIAELNQLPNGDQIAEGQVLQIPPASAIKLTVAPANAPAGAVFEFSLDGANAGEVVTFRIEAPDGVPFTGPPHAASAEGIVTASYRSAGDTPGTYGVAATGSGGTTARASFVVDPG